MTNEIKHFLSGVIKFVFFAGAVYAIMICAWAELGPKIASTNVKYPFRGGGYLFTRLQEVARFSNVDILFLGSSHTYRGFDPRIFREAGYSSFNLGSSAQTPLQTEVLVRRYLDHLNPKVVIYEIDPANFSKDGVESSLDLIANGPTDHLELILALKQNNLKVYNTLIYDTYREIINKNDRFREKPQKGKDSYIPGGYVEREVAFYTETPLQKSRIAVPSHQLRAFEMVVSSVRQKGARLLLVQAPVTSARYRSLIGKEEFDDKMKKYGEYINFNEMASLNDTLHFYDEHHLNQLGVDLFNKEVVQLLKSLNLEGTPAVYEGEIN